MGTGGVEFPINQLRINVIGITFLQLFYYRKEYDDGFKNFPILVKITYFKNMNYRKLFMFPSNRHVTHVYIMLHTISIQF